MKEIAATLQNRIQILGTWRPAFQKGRGSDGVGSTTLRFVLDYITWPNLILNTQFTIKIHEHGNNSSTIWFQLLWLLNHVKYCITDSSFVKHATVNATILLRFPDIFLKIVFLIIFPILPIQYISERIYIVIKRKLFLDSN